MDELISIGRIVKNQGNKGEIRVVPLSDFLERYELLEWVYLFKDDKLIKKKVEKIRFHKQFVIFKLEGINNIEQALSLRDYLIQIPSREKMPLGENEYYIDDIINYSVITHKGEKLGQLSDVLSTSGTDVFLVKGELKEYMIPAAREIILNIDLKNKIIIIKPIPGLLDL
jgi:16S rRNA processing protein RimM